MVGLEPTFITQEDSNLLSLPPEASESLPLDDTLVLSILDDIPIFKFIKKVQRISDDKLTENLCQFSTHPMLYISHPKHQRAF